MGRIFLRKKQSNNEAAPFALATKATTLRQNFNDQSRRSFKIDLKFPGHGCASETYFAKEDDRLFGESAMTQEQISYEMGVRSGAIDPYADQFEALWAEGDEKEMMRSWDEEIDSLEELSQEIEAAVAEEEIETLPAVCSSKCSHRPDDRPGVANFDSVWETHHSKRRRPIRPYARRFLADLLGRGLLVRRLAI